MTRIRNGLVAAIVVTGCAAGGLTAANGASGSRLVPDPSFGAGRGWVSTSVKGWSAASGVAMVMPDGKSVVAGQVFRGSQSQIAIVRYLPDGRRDRSFGDGGRFLTRFPAAASPIFATAIGLQPRTGKVIISGGYGQGSILVVRLRPQGGLDRSFGPGRRGYVTTAVGGIGEAMGLAKDGAIVVGASNANAAGRPMVLARYTRSGRLDSTFGRDGLVSRMFWNSTTTSSAAVSGLVIGRSGGITASGHLDAIGGDGHGSAGVFRVDGSGRSVRSFGNGGHRVIAFRSTSGAFGQWFPCALVPAGGGRVIVTGSGALPGAAGSLLSARLTARGRLDVNFGSGGNGRVVTTGVTDGNTTTCGAASAPGGGIRVGIDRWLVGLTGRGRPDRALGRSGSLPIRTPGSVTLGSIPLSTSDELVASGTSGSRLFLTRYLRSSGLG